MRDTGYSNREQYKVTSGKAKDSNVEATYEYTSGNQTSKRKAKQKGEE